MKRLIILLLCCVVLVSMVGCGGNTASPPVEDPLTTVSKTVITEPPAEKHTRKHCTAGQNRVYSHCRAHCNTDYTHSCRRAEGCTNKKGHQATKKKCHKNKGFRVD